MIGRPGFFRFLCVVRKVTISSRTGSFLSMVGNVWKRHGLSIKTCWNIICHDLLSSFWSAMIREAILRNIRIIMFKENSFRFSSQVPEKKTWTYIRWNRLTARSTRSQWSSQVMKTWHVSIYWLGNWRYLQYASLTAPLNLKPLPQNVWKESLAKSELSKLCKHQVFRTRLSERTRGPWSLVHKVSLLA